MKTPTAVKVTQTEDLPVPVEVLAQEIAAISRGVKAILAGPLNERAIVLLITEASPAAGKGYNRKPISAKTVRAVLAGMESLESQFVKPRKQPLVK